MPEHEIDLSAAGGSPTPGHHDQPRLDAAAGRRRAAVGGARVSRARRARLGIAGWMAIGWLAFVTLAALLAPLLPLDDPNDTVASLVSQPPGTDGHILGGDGLGRDLLSRLVWGARASLLLGVASVLFGLVLGGLLGLVAGYFRGASTPCSPGRSTCCCPSRSSSSL